MQPADVKEVVRKSKNIQGWFSTEAAMLFGWIDEIQKKNGIVGDSFEIGCHHGKSAVLLGALTRASRENLVVCDLFGLQSDNVSGSGEGDLDAFNQNMTNVLDAGITVKIFQKNSAELTATELGRTFRFFHIDGGHNPDEALADLRLGAECIIDSGVLALDDPFRSDWPGVTEAVIRFLDERDDFNAIMVGFNKLILTRKKWSKMYLDEMENLAARESYGFGYPWRVKQLPFHNFDLRIFHIPEHLQKKSALNLARFIYNKTGRIGESFRKPVQSEARTAEAED